MHRADYDFDVISGPSTRPPAPPPAPAPVAPPRLSGDAAPVPSHPVREAPGRGEEAA